MPKNKATRYWIIFREPHVQPHRETYGTIQAAFDAVIDWQRRGVPCMVWDRLQNQYIVFPASNVPA